MQCINALRVLESVAFVLNEIATQDVAALISLRRAAPLLHAGWKVC
jgi:hypothetical protein